MEYGFLGKLDVALIEVTAILEDGRIVPSSSIGNNKTWIDCANRVILEVNSWQLTMALERMHDIYYGPGAAAESQTDSADSAGRPDRHTLFQGACREDCRHRIDEYSGS